MHALIARYKAAIKIDGITVGATDLQRRMILASQRLRQVIATNEANRQADLVLIANAGATPARQALAKQPDAEQKLAALDQPATEQKEKLNGENDALRRAFADGVTSGCAFRVDQWSLASLQTLGRRRLGNLHTGQNDRGRPDRCGTWPSR